MDLFKRLFAGVSIVALSLITVAPAGFANAATMMHGDLIKASNAAIYYYGENGKRYVFPNETTYKTWYDGFSTVKTISDSELSSIPLGGNVVFKPGSYLVKITTDPKVYAIGLNGTLHWVKSESAAKTLWGMDWNKKVKDVPDAYFTNYNTDGFDLDGTKHQPGSLIKYNGSDKMYYVTSDAKKREFTGTSFMDNGFMSKFVNTSPDSITYPNGDAVSGKEKMLWDTAQKSMMGGTTPAPAPGGAGTLGVQLASDTPASSDVPSGTTTSNRGARNIPFSKFNLTAGGSEVKITQVKIKREGLSQDTDLDSIKVFDEMGNQLGSSQSFDANHFATFSGFTYAIPAGQTKALWVKGDSSTTGGKTGRIKLGLASATDIKSSAVTVSGTFPIFGNSMTQVAVDVGQLTVSRGPSDPTSTSLDINQKEFRFLQASLTAGSTEAVKISKFAVRDGDASSVGASDIANVYLKDDTNNKKYVGERIGDRWVFTFNPVISLDKGKQLDLSFVGDVIGGSGKTAAYSLTDEGDWLIWSIGEQYGYDVAVSPVGSTGIDFGNGTATKSETEGFAINQGTLVVSKGANTPATGKVAIGGKDVKVASFEFDVRGEEIRVGSIKVTLTGANGWDVNTESTLYKLIDKDGKIWAGPFDASSGAVTFSNQMTFPIGKTELFLTTDVSSSGLTTASSTFVAAIAAPSSTTNLGTVKGVVSNKTITPSPTSDVTANTMTAESASLIVTMGADPIAGNYVLGASNFHFATVRLDATNGGEPVKVTSLTLGAATFGASIDMSDDLRNFKLWDGSKQIGETEQPTSTDTVVFNIDNPLEVSNKAIKELKVTMDVPSTGITATQTASFEMEAGTGVGLNSGVTVTGESSSTVALTTTPSNDSPALTWQTSGALKVTLDGNNPNAQIVASSTTDLEVVRYKFRAIYEDVDVTELNLYAGDNGGTSTSAVGNTQDPASPADNIDQNVTKVKIYEGTKLLGTTVFSTAGTAKLRLNSGDFRIKKDNDHMLKVVVDLAHKAQLASGKHIYVGFQDASGDGSFWGDQTDSFNMVANGTSSGATIAATSINSTGVANTIATVTVGGTFEAGDLFTLTSGATTVTGTAVTDNTGTAAAIVTAWNANATLAAIATATSAGAVVTLTRVGANTLSVIAATTETGGGAADAQTVTLSSNGGITSGGNKFYTYDGILTVSLNANSPSGNFSQGVGTEVLRLDLTATSDEVTVLELEVFKSGNCIPDGTNAAVLESTDGNTDYFTLASGTAWLGADRELDDDVTSIDTPTALTVGQGETKTVLYRGDTSKGTACTDGQTLQYTVKVDDDGTANNVANGVEWYDQELGSGSPVTATDVVIKNLPVYGNVLEI